MERVEKGERVERVERDVELVCVHVTTRILFYICWCAREGLFIYFRRSFQSESELENVFLFDVCPCLCGVYLKGRSS